MSNYQIGAFEALEWAWHMLRTFKDSPEGIEDARRVIKDVLSEMGAGNQVDFCEIAHRPNCQGLHQSVLVAP